MSRSSHRQQQKMQLQQQQQQMLAQQQQKQQIADNEAAAAAAEMFDLFCVATTMRQILGLHRNMCDLVGLRPASFTEFYPKLKSKVRSWKAQALWKKFDTRAAHRAYVKGQACTGTRVLVIGAGPCGLRTAIEAQLLGAKVVVVEKRDRISRNNVLHLWPFVITDLRNLGAKKFYGKFCAGSIDHISIRQLQCILLKVALLLGVEIHEGVSFENTIEPNGDGCGWRADVFPADHVVSHYEFDVLIGADGKRNTLEGFKRKEFRGKLAIAITANFINKKTEAEAKAEEISGVAFIFNQSFFKELYHTTGIDLENIVYYKDETHYFVMTAKKHSLIDKGVIMQDFADPAELLSPANVNTNKLLDYAREAAEFSTKYQMPNLEFAVNHYGKPDVAMFDFTSMFAAETSCRVIVRKGFRLLQCLVGDSLLEPFWPTGSGCARGFLSSMDAAYAIKLWSNAQNSTLAVLAQRESIYRLLNQTTPENLQRDIGSYTVDPATRYPNLNRTSVNVWQVKHLVDTDDKSILEQTFMDTNALQATQADTPVRRKRRSGDTVLLSTILLRWICAQLHSYEFTNNLKEVSDVFVNGKILCALINRYRPDLVDFNAVKDLPAIECNELAFKILDKELHIPRVMSGKDSTQLDVIDSKVWLNYLEQICEVFRGEIPHVKHPKIDFTELREKYRNYTHAQPDFSKLLQLSSKQKSNKASTLQHDMVDVPHVIQRRSVLDEDKVKRQRKYEILDTGIERAAGAASGSGQQAQTETPRRAKKRRSAEKTANIEERQKRLQEIEENRQERLSRRRQQRYQQTQNFYKSLHMLQANTLLREGDESSPFEDYSIFLYRQQAPVFNDRVKELERKLLYPDRDRGDIPSALPRNNADEQFSDRIKSMEQRISSRQQHGTDKKPKDLMRAIGKIDSSDWNVREIEKKIEQSKRTEVHGPKGREKVPKWSKDQFMARQNKMAKPTRQDSSEEKYKEIDQTLKNLDKQLKEGSVLEVGERGRNKVASIAGQFVKKGDMSEEKNPLTVVLKSTSKVALAFKKQAASEKCHFCKQTVYLMEKIQTEGLILHRSCLKCHHCHTNLRLGGYAFDRDDPNGRFYCTQHFRLPAKPTRPVLRKPGQRKSTQHQQAMKIIAVSAAPELEMDVVGVTVDEVVTADSKVLLGHADTVAQLDLLDRGQTPERIEFENTDAISDGEPSEEHIIDEHEWSGRNFLLESNNDSESDLSSSDESDTDSDSDMFEEANDSPLGVQTLQLATDWIGKQKYSESDVSDDFYDSSEGIADDGKDDTEGEEFKKARELRREEVRLLPLPQNLPTDTETEVQSETESTSPDEVELNSATEISTDSEFDHDEMIREAPKIFIDDTHLGKPTKVQIKSSIITSSTGQRYNAQVKKGGSYLQKYQVNSPQPQFKPLVQVDPTLLSTSRCPLQNPRSGDYLLNKTASTEGIASKKSLELKKRYLLGEQGNGNKIQKSGSTSVLDSKIRSFQSNISECQKLLNPSNDISPSMKTFLDRTGLGGNINNDLLRSKTTTILNDLKVQITIQKASSGVSIDNEKENVFVNSKNELNKGMEYSETVNTTLLESINKKSPSTPTNNQQTIIETIDLVTPEKIIIETINLTTPEKQKSTNDINLLDIPANVEFSNSPNDCAQFLLTTDSNKMIDLACESPIKSDKTIIEEIRADVSNHVKERPDILKHIDSPMKNFKKTKSVSVHTIDEEHQTLLCKSDDEEKRDSPEKLGEQYEHDTVQIQVPTIPWRTPKSDNLSSTTGSSCTSQSSSVEDIQHYILESTTSPDTQTGAVVHMGGGPHKVPRVEIHDTSGTLMQIDSLMIIDGKYVGDPEDLKYMEIPEGIIIPAVPEVRTSVVEEETEVDIEEPVTATPEPAERIVVETDEQPPPLPEKGPPLPEREPPKIKPADLKFDTKNENKIESLKNLPLIVEEHLVEQSKAIKPITLNLSSTRKSSGTPTTPKAALDSPMSPHVDTDKTPTADLVSRGSDSETELTGTGQVLTETELSDWTADDCISENFVDMEFVLNSNKGTIKRNKKGKKKLNSPKLPSTNEVICEVVKVAPVAEFEGILQHIDIDDIEFMDTGSEGSYGEAYSATNTALIRNRGYMEFIEPASTSNTPSHHNVQEKSQNTQYNSVTTRRDQKLGIDYIEQGAYIMQQDDMMKTPVNEAPNSAMTTNITSGKIQGLATYIMTQSLTDSNTLNDLDEDSLCVITPNSQVLGSTTTTADESEALTIVTSPLDTYSPKMKDAVQVAQTKKVETVDGSTPSSSDKNPKTSLSTYTPSSTSATTTSSSKATPTSNENTPAAAIQRTEELSYEEYVRALQQKITQISTVRDSLETRKQRRKSSKGDTPLILNATTTAKTVIEQAQAQPQQQPLNDDKLVSEQVHKVPEIPTLTRKLEEITKERTKQKDLIHDLVMDKLQSKKQLNAEKRLHRSRQRSMLTSGYTSGSSLSPTPKIAAASTTNDANCTNKAHYHISTAAVNNFEENNSLQKSSTSGYMPAYRSSSTRAITRPFSAHLENEQLNVYQLNKTGSFSHVLPVTKPLSGESHATPKTAIVAQQPKSVSASTESLRKEARTRARLKSNSELGLSPEEKMHLLRKRLYAEHALNGKSSTTTTIDTTQSAEAQQPQHYSRHRKISASKSVNDLIYINSIQMTNVDAADAKSDIRTHAGKLADFTSDPNLLALSTVAQSNQKSLNSKNTHRPKDPERRKSIIQSLSSFFHKNSSNPVKEQNDITASGSNSAQPERAFTSGGNNNNSSTNITSVGSNESMFSRFRISPKSKEKSKDKDGLERITNNTTKMQIITSTTTAPTRHTRSHERSNSQGSIYPLHAVATTSSLTGVGVHSPHRNITLSISNSHQSNHQHKHNLKRLTTTTAEVKSATAFSSSSPQLYVHKPYHTFSNNSNTNMTHADIKVADDQTPPPIPPLPFNYQRSDDESYTTETREQKKQRAINKAVRQAELKRLRIAQEIQREQEEIEVQLKELEARGVLIEKAIRGEGQQNMENFDALSGHNDEKMLKELLDIWRNITQLKKRDEELSIRQQELQLEHRHAQLKEELNLRLSCNKLDKSSADVAAEGAILNEMLEIVAKRAALRPTGNHSSTELISVDGSPTVATGAATMPLNMTSSRSGAIKLIRSADLVARAPSYDSNESNI